MWSPALRMLRIAMKMAEAPEEVSRAASPPSREAIRFSTTSWVGLSRRP